MLSSSCFCEASERMRCSEPAMRACTLATSRLTGVTELPRPWVACMAAILRLTARTSGWASVYIVCNRAYSALRLARSCTGSATAPAVAALVARPAWAADSSRSWKRNSSLAAL
ncbi:hypothetical protein D3C76_1423590 [compost metagenome]